MSDRVSGCLSYQVLSEFYVTVTRKLSPGLEPHEAREIVRSLFAWRPAATAKLCEAETLLSEDLLPVAAPGGPATCGSRCNTPAHP